MGIDWLRSCYSTKMKLASGGPVGGSDVSWFFCRPGALPLPFYTVFASRNWTDRYSYGSNLLGEQLGSVRPYRSGATIDPSTGQSTCSPGTAWAGGAAYGGSFNATACCASGPIAVPCCPAPVARTLTVKFLFATGCVGIPNTTIPVVYDGDPQWLGYWAGSVMVGNRELVALAHCDHSGVSPSWCLDFLARVPGSGYTGVAFGVESAFSGSCSPFTWAWTGNRTTLIQVEGIWSTCPTSSPNVTGVHATLGP